MSKPSSLSLKILSTFVSLTLVAGLMPVASWADEEAAAEETVVEIELSTPQEEPTPEVNIDAPHREGVILVGFKDGTAIAQAQEALQPLSDPDEALQPLEESDLEEGWPVTVDIDPTLSVAQAIDLALQDENVAYAQPDYLYDLTPIIYESEPFEVSSDEDGDDALGALATTNDPALKSFTPSISAANAWQLERMNVLNAWNKVKTNNTVTVAVLDTGCRVTHEDLKDRILTQYMYDFINDSATMTDLCGHGTEVSGMIAATANNGKGTAGSSYNARILPLRVGGPSADDNHIQTGAAISAYKYLINLSYSHPELNLHVVNASFGYYGTIDPALETAINKALSHDIITVAAGGNGDDDKNPVTSIHTPSDISSVVAVTALSHTGTTSSGAHGTSPTSWSNYNAYKDLIAPGSCLYTTNKNSDSSYVVTYGTSVACPLVAGVFALAWAANPNLSAAQVRSIVEGNVYTDFTVASGRTKSYYGKGIPNALAIVNAALATESNSKETVLNLGFEECTFAPWVSGYRYSTTQVIYPASEIGRAGTISKLSYYVERANSNYTGSLKIYLGHTSKSSFSSPNDYIPLSQQTLCYNNINRTTNKNVGWESFQLGTSFSYNGTSNLVVTVMRSIDSSYTPGRTSFAGMKKDDLISLSRSSSSDSSYADPANLSFKAGDYNSPALKLTFTVAAGVKTVDKPTAKNLTYNGSQQYAVATNAGYTISGTYGATNAGTYSCTVTPKSGYAWSDGTTGSLSLTWTMKQKSVATPKGSTLKANGSYQVGVKETDEYSVSGTFRACEPGRYTAQATLKSSNYLWSDGTSDPRIVNWRIGSDTGATVSTTTFDSIAGEQTTATKLPLLTHYRWASTQMIYTPSEVGGAGTITRLSFFVYDNNTGYDNTTALRIYLCTTSKSSFASGTDSLDLSDARLVYVGKSALMNGKNGEWVDIDLNTAFAYDGVSNLGVFMCHVSSDTTSSTGVIFRASTRNGMALYRLSNTDWTVGSYEGTSAYEVGTTRPDARFTIQQASRVANYVGSTNAVILYAPKPAQGCLTCNGTAMVYDETKHAWILPTNTSISALSNWTLGIKPSASPTVISTRGDVNSNKSVNIVDSQLAYDMARRTLKLGSSGVTTKALAAADANHDNVLDAADALAIQHYVVRGSWS